MLFKVNNCKYFAPLSSPKPKHKTMKDTMDFLKIAEGELGAINFNNMLPVKDNNIIILDLDTECLTKEENKYMKMLKKQLYWLNRNKDKIYRKSKKLYNKYKNNTLSEKLKNRCCNFILLEEKSEEYNKTKLEPQTLVFPYLLKIIFMIKYTHTKEIINYGKTTKNNCPIRIHIKKKSRRTN